MSLLTGPAFDVTERALARLRRCSYLALRNLSCEYRDGVLVLRGCLPSYYLKQMAQSAVANLEGVHRVVNEVQVFSALCPARG